MLFYENYLLNFTRSKHELLNCQTSSRGFLLIKSDLVRQRKIMPNLIGPDSITSYRLNG